MYSYRLIRTGKRLREQSFDKPIYTYSSCSSKKPTIAPFGTSTTVESSQEPQQPERDYRLENVRRKQRLIDDLAHANFDNRFTTLVTFTYRENLVDVQKANKDFNLFVKRLKDKLNKYDYPYKGFEFRYIKVIEFQERNAIHFHVVCNLRVFPFSKSVVQKWKSAGTLRSDWKDKDNLQDIWRGKNKDKGNADLEQVEHKDMPQVVSYLTQYMTKDMLYDERLRGEKAYSSSKNLEQPMVLYDDEAEEYLRELKKQEKLVVSENRKDTWVFTPDALPEQTITQTTYYITS